MWLPAALVALVVISPSSAWVLPSSRVTLRPLNMASFDQSDPLVSEEVDKVQRMPYQAVVEELRQAGIQAPPNMNVLDVRHLLVETRLRRSSGNDQKETTTQATFVTRTNQFDEDNRASDPRMAKEMENVQRMRYRAVIEELRQAGIQAPPNMNVDDVRQLLVETRLRRTNKQEAKTQGTRGRQLEQGPGFDQSDPRVADEMENVQRMPYMAVVEELRRAGVQAPPNLNEMGVKRMLVETRLRLSQETRQGPSSFGVGPDRAVGGRPGFGARPDPGFGGRPDGGGVGPERGFSARNDPGFGARPDRGGGVGPGAGFDGRPDGGFGGRPDGGFGGRPGGGGVGPSAGFGARNDPGFGGRPDGGGVGPGAGFGGRSDPGFGARPDGGGVGPGAGFGTRPDPGFGTRPDGGGVRPGPGFGARPDGGGVGPERGFGARPDPGFGGRPGGGGVGPEPGFGARPDSGRVGSEPGFGGRSDPGFGTRPDGGGGGRGPGAGARPSSAGSRFEEALMTKPAFEEFCNNLKMSADPEALDVVAEYVNNPDVAELRYGRDYWSLIQQAKDVLADDEEEGCFFDFLGCQWRGPKKLLKAHLMEEHSLTCPRDHSMLRIVNSEPGRVCNNCGQTIVVDGIAFNCERCQYDECPGCFSHRPVRQFVPSWVPGRDVFSPDADSGR